MTISETLKRLECYIFHPHSSSVLCAHTSRNKLKENKFQPGMCLLLICVSVCEYV